jgi:hypothetical protein
MRSYLALSQLTIATTRLLPWGPHTYVPPPPTSPRPPTGGGELP